MSSSGLARIDALMADHIARNTIQGAVTAVSRKDRLVHFQAHGFSDLRTKVPMQTNALFRVMSSTKPLTAIAMLQQVEEGRLHLDAPVGRFIPQLATMVVLKADQPAPDPLSIVKPQVTYRPDQLEPLARPITIRDLLTHTSGMNGFLPHRKGDTLATYVPRLRSIVLDFQPGSRWSYSGLTGPDVLARVVELISGKRFDRYLTERIFNPVGMIDTGHNLSAGQWGRLVHRAFRNGDSWASAKGNEVPLPDGSLIELPLAVGNSTYFDGSGGLKSTASDYIRLYTMLANGGSIGGRQVLRRESVQLMISDLARGLLLKSLPDEQGRDFGALVATVTDPGAAKSGRPAGSFGWGGAFGTESWANTRNGVAAVLLVQQPVADLAKQFDTAVNSAILS